MFFINSQSTSRKLILEDIRTCFRDLNRRHKEIPLIPLKFIFFLHHLLCRRRLSSEVGVRNFVISLAISEDMHDTNPGPASLTVGVVYRIARLAAG